MTGTYGSPAPTGQQPSGWAVGWTAFAGTMMVIQGMWWAVAGLVALFDDDILVVTPEYLFKFDLTAWGWIHLALGVIIFVSGLALFSGAPWARIVGVLMAIIAAIAAFSWVPYYPVWGISLIVISGFVIWALTAHGRDITELE